MKDKTGKYTIERSSNGFGIYYEDKLVPKFLVEDRLNEEDAKEWCKRLNLAYTFGASNAIYSIHER